MKGQTRREMGLKAGMGVDIVSHKGVEKEAGARRLPKRARAAGGAQTRAICVKEITFQRSVAMRSSPPPTRSLAPSVFPIQSGTAAKP